jgi:hypothetical protein
MLRFATSRIIVIFPLLTPSAHPLRSTLFMARMMATGTSILPSVTEP